MAKPTVAFYWCASCGGCEEAVFDLAEDALPLFESVDLAFWPVALDYKLEDVRAWRSAEVSVALISGSIRSDEDEMWVRLLRDRCALVGALGACAHLGGIPGLANAATRTAILEGKYLRGATVSNPLSTLPRPESRVGRHQLELPELLGAVKSLDQVIDVDFYLPGCAPPPASIARALGAVLSGSPPAKRAVFASEKALCETCPRKDTMPERSAVTRFRRVATSTPDPQRCFLAEEYVCLGQVTRGGCGERCIHANMPCRGCFGPTPDAVDQGAKFLSSLGAVTAAELPEAASALARSLPDPLGTLYRYSLPTSLLRRGAPAKEHAR